MIRSYPVKVSIAASYNQYLQRQVEHYNRYVAGSKDAIGHDMEVAEAPTRVAGNAQAASAIGLRTGETPGEDAITRVSCGCHAESGSPLTRRAGPVSEHRTAYQDLVFSAGKSVSVEFAAARAAGDEVRAQQLLGAMTESVEGALAHIQELVPLGRRRVGAEGVQVAVPAKLTALLDVHSAARPVRGQSSGDPHLHVHTRVLNLGLQEDGQVASVNYWQLYQNIRPLNALFECGLRARLEQLGYATVDTTHGEHRHWASFELAKQDEALSMALSARTEHVQHLAALEWEQRQAGLLATHQVAAALQGAAGVPGQPILELTQAQREAVRPTAAQVAALSRASREQKLAETHAELAEEWGRVVAAHGYRHSPSDAPQPPCRPGAWARGRVVVGICRRALSQEGIVAGRSVFDRADILEHVAAPAVQGRLSETEMRRIADRVEAQAEQLTPTVHEPMGAFTTATQMRLERESVAIAADMADEATVSVAPSAVGSAIAEEERQAGHVLDPEQATAVEALCGPSGWVQIVGVAGSGKTTVCRPAVTALRRSGYQVLGVSLSQAATDVLAAETGVPAWNLADFTTRVTNGQLRTPDGAAVSLGPQTVLFVDEAGTVDSTRWHEFTGLCREWRIAGVRVLGDPEQTQPVGSGSVLGWLSRHLPTTYLTLNYRQGVGSVESEASRLLRDGRGAEFLRLKDRLGQLWIDATAEVSAERATQSWGTAIRDGGDPRQHVLLSDLVDVAAQLNRGARAEFDRIGRLSSERVVAGGREWAVGERVVFAKPHRSHVVDDGGPRRHGDDALQRRRVRIPRRTQGELVGIERAEEGGAVLRIRTDSRGRLPSRVVEVPEDRIRRTLDYGYAMTTTVAQGRTWDSTYRVLTSSRLSGRQQEYPAATRHVSRSLLFGDLQSVSADVDAAESVRDDAIERYGELISRDVAKASTLDHLSPADRQILEDWLAPRYLRAPSLTLTAPMSERQIEYLTRLGRQPQEEWSWVRASVEIDAARGQSPGRLALGWLRGQGVRADAAWSAVDCACREAGVGNAAAPPAVEAPPFGPRWDGAALLDQVRAERRGRQPARRAATARPDARGVPLAPGGADTAALDVDDKRSGDRQRQGDLVRQWEEEALDVTTRTARQQSQDTAQQAPSPGRSRRSRGPSIGP